MNVHVYGKTDCGLCETAKSRLDKLGIEYTFIDLENPPEEWRGKGIVSAMAEYHFREVLPIIDVDGIFYTYPMLMKAMKKKEMGDG